MPFTRLGRQQGACDHQGADAVDLEKPFELLDITLVNGLLGLDLVGMQYAGGMDREVDATLL